MKTVLVITRADQLRRADKMAAIYAYGRSRAWTVHSVNLEIAGRPFRVLVRALKPDGAIIEGSISGRLLDRRSLKGVPCVDLDTGFAGARHAVSSDSAAIAECAFAELMRWRPAAAAFVTLSPREHWSKERLARFRELAGGAGLPFFTMSAELSDVVSAKGAFSRQLPSLPRPLAVFTVHDETAECIYAAARCAGLAIPEDMRIVSVGNNPVFATTLEPSLTSIELDSYGAGKAAAGLLDRLLSDPGTPPEHIRIPPSGLVRRTSSVALGGSNTGVSAAISFIRDNACRGISVRDVCRAVKMARRTCETRFLAATGRTVHAEIASVRFERVEQLLANGHTAIGAIANLCGWRSTAHLARAFRNRYGATMSGYRRRVGRQTLNPGSVSGK